MNLVHLFILNRGEIFKLTLEHLFLVLVATFAATLAGIPLGILLSRKPWLRKPVLGIANVLQTIPSLALFGFLIPILGSHGIGRVPAILALFLYSLLPIIRNTFTGINGVDPSIREAAIGMGMTDWQLLVQVELPLALPVLLAGVRVATVISVGTATIAAAIGAGGLGTFIFRGLRMNDNGLLLMGAIPAALMALLADFLLGRIEEGFAPPSKGIRGKQTSTLHVKLQTWSIAVLLSLSILGLLFYAGQTMKTSSAKPSIVIGSKDFTEQVLLGEILAQWIEKKTGLPVERKFELGGDLCHRALVAGEIDGYVEYTGTAYAAILKHPPGSDANIVFQTVKKEYRSKFHAVWLNPLGFNDTFAILIRANDAKRFHLINISDIAAHAPQWKAGFGQDFMSRQDGYPGFARIYHLHFQENPKEMDLSLTYRALALGQVDLIAGNSTDGLIDKLHLFELRDDRHYFPPYVAAPVFSEETLRRHPAIQTAVQLLAGKISNAEMRKMNLAVDEAHRSVQEVAGEFLDRLR